MSFIFNEQRGQTDYTLAEMLATRTAGLANWSGEKVDQYTALGIPAVLACVSLLADSIASLPMRVQRWDQGRKIYVDSPTWLKKPNNNQQKFGFIHQIIASLALHGNSYIFVDRDRQGRVVAVENIHPNNVKVHMRGMEKIYEMKDKTILTNNNILHIVWFSYPQEAVGLSPIKMQKNTMGLALAMERHINQFYSQGATPSSVLETDRDLTADQASSLQATWTSHHTRSRKPAVLTGGLKWKAVSAEAGESLVQARDQVTQEIARIFRIPSYLINSKGDSQTYSNVESAGINFVRHTLLAWISRLEDNLSTLIAGQSFINFDTSYYLRGDQLSRIRAGQAGISTGIFTPNEVREWFDYEPYENGDDFYLGIQGAVANEGKPLGTDVGSAYDEMGDNNGSS